MWGGGKEGGVPRLEAQEIKPVACRAMPPKKASTSRSSSTRGSPGGSAPPGSPSGRGIDENKGWQDAVVAFQKLSPEGSAAAAGPSTANQQHYAQVHMAWQEIVSHPIFAGIIQEKPLALSEGASTAPFSQTDFDAKQSAAPPAKKDYEAGANVFWINLYWSAAPLVPINRAAVASSAVTLGTFARQALLEFRLQVQYLVQFFFATPSRFPTKIVVGLLNDTTPTVTGQCGMLKGLSPEENRHAFIFAIARDIKNGVPDSTLQQWRNISLSTYVEFRPTISDQLKNKQTIIPLGP